MRAIDHPRENPMRIPALLAALAALSAPWPAAAETATQFRDA